jgi:hypothetical protein
MPELPYVCTATPIQSGDFNGVVTALGVDAASIWALLTVESGKAGFLPDRRPPILFERAVFHKQTNGQYDATNPGISAPTWGGYSGGAAEYGRLAEAYALDADAALQSASWGISQIMGFNYSAAGYATVSAYVADCCASEAAQLKAFESFLEHTGIADGLRAHDWTAVATHYNGTGQVATYAGLLESNYNKLSDPSAQPDISVRAAQLYLSYLANSSGNAAYNPGGIDGQIGAPGHSKTLTALNAFQTDQGIATTTVVDDGVLASLAAAQAAPVNLLLA